MKHGKVSKLVVIYLYSSPCATPQPRGVHGRHTLTTWTLANFVQTHKNEYFTPVFNDLTGMKGVKRVKVSKLVVSYLHSSPCAIP